VVPVVLPFDDGMTILVAAPLMGGAVVVAAGAAVVADASAATVVDVSSLASVDSVVGVTSSTATTSSAEAVFGEAASEPPPHAEATTPKRAMTAATSRSFEVRERRGI
jgi:hypothetical protein